MKFTIRALFVVLSLIAALPLSATTYKMVSDQDLADQAQVIVEARVVAVESAPVVGRPATDYQIEIERVLKGDLPGSTIIVRVPGGIGADGIGLKIWGAPHYQEGDKALLFLNPGRDGVYRPLHLMLGAFHIEKVGDRSIAVRELADTVEIGPKGAGPGSDLMRDVDGFSEWLSDRALGVPHEQDYVLGSAAGTTGKALGQANDKFSLLLWSDRLAIRWFRFDEGQAVEWRVNSAGQPGLGLDRTVEAFKTALQTWDDDPATNIRYEYVGTTESTTGLSDSDDVNAIVFDDPFKDDPRNAVEGTFTCRSGGVLAIGGPFFTLETRAFRGERYHEAVEADIVTNDGTECFFRDNPSAAEEVFAHELGHTLGLGHSAEDNALMRAVAHDDGRGARLDPDDRAGVAHLYGGGAATKPPAAAKRLVAKAVSSTQVRLTWRDMAKDEDDYVVELKVGNQFVQLAESAPMNAKSLDVTGLEGGQLYIFRVRARNTAGLSAPSNQAKVTTPRARR